MATSALATQSASRPSALAGSLIGSEILKIAADVRALAADGRDICNLTVGDFAPSEFRIPPQLEQGIVDALHRGETNYPPSDGILPLRETVRALYARELGFTPELKSIIVTGGSRPGKTMSGPGGPGSGKTTASLPPSRRPRWDRPSST